MMSFWDSNICKKVGQQNFFVFVCVLFITLNTVIIFYGLLLAFFSDLFTFQIEKQQLNLTPIKIISSCVIAPIIETLLCQNLLIYLVNKLSKNKTLQLFIPSFIFGILHFANVFTIIHGFLMGLIFNFGFISTVYLAETAGTSRKFPDDQAA